MQQLHGFEHDSLQALRLSFLSGAQLEVQDLAGERAGGLAGPHDLFQIALRRVFGIKIVHGQAGVTQDRRQQVVEVVDDAAGEDAEGFHGLGPLELVTQVLGLGLEPGDALPPPAFEHQPGQPRAGSHPAQKQQPDHRHRLLDVNRVPSSRFNLAQNGRI